MSTALNNFCCAARTRICDTYASSISCQCCQLMSVCALIQFIYRSPVGKKGHPCRRQPVTTVREPCFSQLPSSPKVQSVSFAMLKAEAAWVFQAPQLLCEEDSLVADAAVWRLPGSLSLPGIMLPVPVRARMSRALNNFCRAGKTRICGTCTNLMSCQSCKLMGRSCSSPVHVDHQYWRKGRHAGVRQWPLWENHSLHSSHPRH